MMRWLGSMMSRQSLIASVGTLRGMDKAVDGCGSV